MRAGCAIVALVASLWMLPGSAAAQDKVDYEAAKLHYKNGELAAQAGNWPEAAKEYGIAYEITKDPILFFKIGNAYDEAGDCEAALVYYGRYLSEAKPDEKFREKTEAKIAACKAKASEPKQPVVPDTPPADDGTVDPFTSDDEPAGDVAGSGDGGGDGPPSFLDEEPTWQRTAAWASVGAVVTFATVGAVLGLSAGSREEDIENLFLTAGEPEVYEGAVKKRYDDLIDEGKQLETLSYVAFAATGVAAAAAITFFLIDPGSGDGAATAVTPSLGPDQVGVSARWSF